jgi:hypothetical protein
MAEKTLQELADEGKLTTNLPGSALLMAEDPTEPIAAARTKVIAKSDLLKGDFAISVMFGDGENLIQAKPVPVAWAKVPVAATIKLCEVESIGDVGSITVDIWKVPFASWPPSNGNSITGGLKPTLSGVDKSQISVLTGWTTAVSAGEYLLFKVDDASLVTLVGLSLVLGKA